MVRRGEFPMIGGMDTFNTLTTAEVQKLLRLLGSLYDRSAQPALWKERLLGGLCRLVGGSAGLCALAGDVLPGRRWRYQQVTQLGWGQGAAPAALGDWLAGSAPPDPMEAMVGRRPLRSTLTRTRAQVIEDEAWQASAHRQQVRRPLGVDECIYSLQPLSRPGWASVLSLHRPWGQHRPFTAHDALLVHLVHFELSGFFERELAIAQKLATSNGQLTPRMRQTLDLLLGGASEKKAAAALGLSPNTLHVHVRSLYRHFHVNTRAELLSQFLSQSRR